MSDRSRLRLIVLHVLVVSILGTLLGRLWYLQVYDGAKYAQAASDNRIRTVVAPAPRGQIFDAQGRLVVRNRVALVVSVNRAMLRRESDGGKAVLKRLSRVLGIAVPVLDNAITPCVSRLGNGQRVKTKEGCWNGSPYQPVPVAEYDAENGQQASRVLAIEERREDFPGVTATFQAVRGYPYGSLAAHELGYLGPLQPEEKKTNPAFASYPSTSLVGRTGVEETYDAALHGVDGVQRLLVDKDGTVSGTLDAAPAKAGDSLVLSMDAGVQRLAETALLRGVVAARGRFDKDLGRNFKAPSGAVVVMEARTGRLVAMASYPSYDPKVFVGGLTKPEFRALTGPGTGEPLISRATQGLFAPGSTFKPVTTSAAVADGAPLDGYYFCPSSVQIGTSTKRNFEGAYLGSITLRTALIKSCDTVYYRLAVDEWSRDGGNTPIDKPKESMVRMARIWGFGARTGVDLPSDLRGSIVGRSQMRANWEAMKADYCAGAKNPTFSAERRAFDQEKCTDGFRYNAGDAANFAVGQGDVVATPLQLTTAYAALANGGLLLAPRAGKALLSADGSSVRTLPPVVRRRLPVDPRTLAYIREALSGVTDTGGTAAAAYAGFPRDKLVVAGKTGTAQVRPGVSDTSWFASFAPAADPQYVVVAMVEEAGTGGSTAAPITREIWEGMYGLTGKPPLIAPRPSDALPVVRPDGVVVAPGTKLAHAIRPRVTPYVPPSAPSPTPSPPAALGPLSPLPDSDRPRRVAS